MKIVDKKEFVVVFVLMVLATLFLLTPMFVRSMQGNNALIGEESYLHLGLAQNSNGAQFPFPKVQTTLFDSVVAVLLLLTNSPLLVGKFFPLFLGLASLLIFQKKLSSLFADQEEKSLSGLLFIISPLFIVVFTSLNPYAFILFLALLSWALFDKRKWASMFFLVLIAGVDLKSFMLVSALLVGQSLSRKDEWKLPLIVVGVTLLVSLLIEAITGYVALDPLLTNASLNSLLASFGSDVGYSLFISILALIGAVSLWTRKRENILFSLIVLAIFIFSFNELSARVVLLPLLAILASVGLLKLFNRAWSIQELKDFTLFIIFLAMMFTLILTVSSRCNDQPDLDMMDALLFLQSAPDEDFILSSKDNGILIERIAKQPAFLDNVRKNTILAKERAVIADEIFSSQRMAKTEHLLQENGISHILIDNTMRNGDIWTADEQGLLFLVKYSHKFVLVYHNKNIEIYRYIAS